MKRDLTQEWYETKLREAGIGPCEFMGYRNVGNGVHVSELNGGSRRRDRLAYLLAEQKRVKDRQTQ